MNEIPINNWKSFEAVLSQTFATVEKVQAEAGGYVSTPLFRGHADRSWELRTTLERFSTKSYSIADYYRILLSVAPAVASLTAKAWPVWLDLEFEEGYHGPPPGYEFMIYLRHHGFPSPLLDWSCSPYVAAFFAFEARPKKGCDAVALYTYVEHLGHGKTWSGDQPRIIGLGSNAVTHERHYSQQCEYTICKKRVGDKYIYWNHEEALNNSDHGQDFLTKYVVPISERRSFLRRLESMNINAYSLFRDESSLMQTLAYREIETREPLT